MKKRRSRRKNKNTFARLSNRKQAALKSQIDLLLIENREQLETTLTNLEGLKSASKIHVASLKNLEEVLPTLDSEVGKRSELGAYENELKQNSAELKPDASKTALLQPGRMKPSIPFAKSQGLLPLPVQGRMLTRFAQNGDDGAPSKGVHLETRAGAQVVSPCDGWILYAGPFRSYGSTLDYQSRWRLSYCDSRDGSRSGHSRPIRARWRAGWSYGHSRSPERRKNANPSHPLRRVS